jgi:hypothetical protein
MAESALLQESDEADARGLELGRKEGEAFGQILKHMLEDVADGGEEIAHGDYLIAYAFEKAEGMYVPRDGKLEWMAPERENIHIEIAVRDRADGRMLPALDVEVTLTDEKGKDVGTHKQPLLWHPYLYHYGRNWVIPGDGAYSLRVRFPAPQFHRHDKTNGRRFAEGAEVTFKDVELKTGRE